MKSVPSSRLAIGALTLVLCSCAPPETLVLAPDDPDGHRLVRAVDDPEAHELLVEILRENAAPSPAPSPPLGASAAAPAPVAPAAVPTQAELNALGREVSMDFAALTFARALLDDPRNEPTQNAFERAVADGPERSEALLRRPGAFPYTVLFAPGWLYEQHPKSGADFAAQRQLLDRLGIAHRLIPTEESGSVETNAAAIAAAIRDGAARGETLLLVSASKAGPEVAYALSTLLTRSEIAPVAGWINASAAFAGSPLADWALRAPLSWAVHAWARLADVSLDGVRALRPEPSRARLTGASIPESVAIVNLVPVPVSQTLGKTVRGGYWIMRRRGPTDGVVPIADTLWPTGVELVALGTDHLLGEFRNDPSALALLRATAYTVGRHRCRHGFADAVPLEVLSEVGSCTALR